MKILETIHSKKRYYLVFDGTDIVGKFENKDMALEWIKQEVEQNKQAQNA